MDPHGVLFGGPALATVRASTPWQPTDTLQTVDALRSAPRAPHPPTGGRGGGQRAARASANGAGRRATGSTTAVRMGVYGQNGLVHWGCLSI